MFSTFLNSYFLDMISGGKSIYDLTLNFFSDLPRGTKKTKEMASPWALVVMISMGALLMMEFAQRMPLMKSYLMQSLESQRSRKRQQRNCPLMIHVRYCPTVFDSMLPPMANKLLVLCCSLMEP